LNTVADYYALDAQLNFMLVRTSFIIGALWILYRF
jgi:hypothetical protein